MVPPVIGARRGGESHSPTLAYIGISGRCQSRESGAKKGGPDAVGEGAVAIVGVRFNVAGLAPSAFKILTVLMRQE